MSNRNVARPCVPRLSSVFSEDCILKIPMGTKKKDVLELLLQSLANTCELSPLAQVPALLQNLLDRERTGTSGIGKGLALPHLRCEFVYRFVGAIGLAPDGIDFQSIDGGPTKLIFLLLGPHEQREQHIELMGRLSALMQDKSTLMFLQGHRTPHAVHDFLEDLDARSDEGSRNASAFVTNTTAPRAVSMIGAGLR